MGKQIISPQKPLVAISSCLLGELVRYDGAEKRDAFICDKLSQRFQWLPICPEVGIGMSVPRTPIHLQQTEAGIRIVEVADPSIDVTKKLAEYARVKADISQICGYIFKSRSPSCGMHQLPIHNQAGKVIAENGIGEYARVFQQERRDIPFIDEIELRKEKKSQVFFKAVEEHFLGIPSIL